MQVCDACPSFFDRVSGHIWVDWFKKLLWFREITRMASIYDQISSALSTISTLGKRTRPDDGSFEDQHSVKHQHVLSFSPFDQAALHNRLLTFKPLHWFSKPEACSAIECACMGWQNEDRDCLR